MRASTLFGNSSHFAENATTLFRSRDQPHCLEAAALLHSGIKWLLLFCTHSHLRGNALLLISIDHPPLDGEDDDNDEDHDDNEDDNDEDQHDDEDENDEDHDDNEDDNDEEHDDDEDDNGEL